MNENENNVADLSAVDEELVAYLDGELDASGATRVERRLADDPEYRQRLTDLQRAWDSLDLLERTEADEDFTHSTVAMVALRAEQDVKQEQSTVALGRRLWWAGGTALALASATAGYMYLSTILATPNQQLVRDLPVIERMDELRHAESVEFLQKLQAEGLFAGELDDAL